MIKSLADLEALDVEAVASAIEADAGGVLPDLRPWLQEAKAGQLAAVYTPEALSHHRAGYGRAFWTACVRQGHAQDIGRRVCGHS